MSEEEQGAGLALGTIVVSCAAVIVVLSVGAYPEERSLICAMLGVVLILLLRNSTTAVPDNISARAALAASYGLCCLLILGALFYSGRAWELAMGLAWALFSVVSYVVVSVRSPRPPPRSPHRARRGQR